MSGEGGPAGSDEVRYFPTLFKLMPTKKPNGINVGLFYFAQCNFYLRGFPRRPTFCQLDDEAAEADASSEILMAAT